jgi:hypothetical protein
MGKTVYVSLSGKYCVNPTNDLIRELKSSGIRINGFELKAGRNPGYGYLLMIKEDLPDILDVENLVLKISDGNETVEIDGIVIADTWANHPKLTDQSLILVKIADSRIMAVQMPTRLANDPFPPHVSIPQPAGVVASWTDGIGAYWDNSNVRTPYSAVSKISADFPTVLLRDVHFDVQDTDWQKLNDVLDLCCHQVYKDYTGYSIKAVKNHSSVNTGIDLNQDTLAIEKRHDLTYDKVERPYQTNHIFRKWSNNFNIDFRSSPQVVTNTTSSLNYFSNTDITIPVYNIYVPEDPNAATYLTDLQSLAQKLSQLYYDAFDAHELLDAEYFGVHKFIPSGSAVSIEFYHDEVGYVTKVRSVDMGEWVFPKVPRLYYQTTTVRMVKAPAGGIPGRVGTLLGGATCDVYRQNTTSQQIEDSGVDIKVYNWTTTAACTKGDRYGMAAWCNNGWHIIAEDCNDTGSTQPPVTGGGTVKTPTDPISPQFNSVVTSGTFSQVRYTSGTGTGGI